MAPPTASTAHVMQIDATLSAFGTAPSQVALEVTPRSTSWRLSRAVGSGVPGLLFFAMAILPPHALWVLAGLLLCALAVRKFRERYTLEALSGRCPHCEGDLSHSNPTRLKERSSLTCDGCQRSSELLVDMAALPTATRTGA